MASASGLGSGRAPSRSAASLCLSRLGVESGGDDLSRLVDLSGRHGLELLVHERGETVPWPFSRPPGRPGAAGRPSGGRMKPFQLHEDLFSRPAPSPLAGGPSALEADQLAALVAVELVQFEARRQGGRRAGPFSAFGLSFSCGCLPALISSISGLSSSNALSKLFGLHLGAGPLPAGERRAGHGPRPANSPRDFALSAGSALTARPSSFAARVLGGRFRRLELLVGDQLLAEPDLAADVALVVRRVGAGGGGARFRQRFEGVGAEAAGRGRVAARRQAVPCRRPGRCAPAVSAPGRRRGSPCVTGGPAPRSARRQDSLAFSPRPSLRSRAAHTSAASWRARLPANSLGQVVLQVGGGLQGGARRSSSTAGRQLLSVSSSPRLSFSSIPFLEPLLAQAQQAFARLQGVDAPPSPPGPSAGRRGPGPRPGDALGVFRGRSSNKTPAWPGPC